MSRDEFRIGQTFYTGSGGWICTDVITRVLIAIEKDRYEELRLGAPESFFDEDDMASCSLLPDDFAPAQMLNS